MNLENYAPVADRLALYWAENPNGRIHTDLVVDDGTRVMFRAEVYRDIADPIPVTIGYAEEIRGSSTVNRTSALENCETSSIGRALSNWKFQASPERPSREEMAKVARQSEPATSQATRTTRVGDRVPGGLTPPSEAQIALIRKLGHSGPMPQTKQAASSLITTLKNAQAALDARHDAPEEPF